MCTATYIPIPKQNSFVFTHNRDEFINRQVSHLSYLDDLEILCPKDPKAHGTWYILCIIKKAINA